MDKSLALNTLSGTVDLRGPDTETLSSASPAGDALPAVASSSLLRGRSVVRIEHNGALYQLRNTRLGKLILTK